MTASSSRGYFKLAKQFGGIGRYAVVEVSVSSGVADVAPAIVWEGEALRLRDAEIARGVERGIAMALDVYPSPVREVRILQLRIFPVDTTEECLAYAACFAVWDALQVCGCNPPRLENGKFDFPASP